MQWLLAYAVNLIVGFFESSFKKDDSSRNNTTTDNDFFNDTQTNCGTAPAASAADAQRLKEAYELLQSTPPCDLEEVRKKYKKLSLIHHPDRNGGSQESHEMMQKLNACFALIEKDLTKEDDDGMTEEEFEEEWNRRQEVYEEARRQMEKEMKEEMKRYRKAKKKFHKSKVKDTGHCHHKQKEMKLDSEEGRKKAHEMFVRQVNTMMKEQTATTNTKRSLAKDNGAAASDEKTTGNYSNMDDNHHQGYDASTKDVPNESCQEVKPKNYVMEYNVDEIVVAMRLGMPDVALGVMEDQINNYIQHKAQEAYFTSQRVINLKKIGLQYLRRPLDFDDNSLLHYAIYYEAYQMIRAVCGTAIKFEGLDKIMYQRNKYGQTPLAFAEIVQDETVKTLIQTYVDSVEAIRIKTRLVPAVKSAALRSWGVLRNLDYSATFGTLLSFWVGLGVFHLHYLTSLAGVVLAQKYVLMPTEFNPQEEVSDSPGIAEVAMLLSFFGLWKFARVAFNYLSQFIMLEFVLLLLPFVVAVMVCWSQRRRRGPLELPISLLLCVSGYMERMLEIHYRYLTPTAVHANGFVKHYFLVLILVLGSGYQQRDRYLPYGLN